MVWLWLGSSGATLGGLLTLSRLAFLITGNLSISYPCRDVALAMNDPVLELSSSRLIALPASSSLPALAATSMLPAVKPRPLVAGGRTNVIVAAVFACSGALAALGGPLLSYRTAASGVALTDGGADGVSHYWGRVVDGRQWHAARAGSGHRRRSVRGR